MAILLILLFSNFWGKPTRMVGTAQNLSDARLQESEQFFPRKELITLQGTNISPKNGILKMIFLFPFGGIC